MKKLLTGFLSLLVLSGSAMAQMAPPPPPGAPPGPPPAPPRTIAVSGDAHEEVTPDQAILSVGLTSRDKNLHLAKQHNDAMVEKLVDTIQHFDIPKEKIATSNVTIAPQYNYDNKDGTQHFSDYMVSRSLRITLDNIDISEKVLSAVVDAKVDQVNGLEYRLSKPETHEDALRVKAFADAKAKAEALAQAAGAKLGPAIMISTEGANVMPRPPHPMPMMAAAMRSAEPPSLPSMVELNETVMVTFALE